MRSRLWMATGGAADVAQQEADDRPGAGLGQLQRGPATAITTFELPGAPAA